MEIYLIRHTTPDIDKGVIYGRLDVDLMETFGEEASVIVAQLPEQIGCVYSSPSTRCLRLAEKISKNVQTDERLRELNFGAWEGARWDDIDRLVLQNWMDDWLHRAPEQGESFTQMAQRVHQFWLQITSGKNSPVVIVSHAGVIRIIHTFVLGKKMEEAFDLKLTYGAVCKIDTERRTLRILSDSGI